MILCMVVAAQGCMHVCVIHCMCMCAAMCVCTCVCVRGVCVLRRVGTHYCVLLVWWYMHTIMHNGQADPCHTIVGHDMPGHTWKAGSQKYQHAHSIHTRTHMHAHTSVHTYTNLEPHRARDTPIWGCMHAARHTHAHRERQARVRHSHARMHTYTRDCMQTQTVMCMRLCTHQYQTVWTPGIHMRRQIHACHTQAYTTACPYTHPCMRAPSRHAYKHV